MEVAYSTLLQRDVARNDTEVMIGSTRPFAKDDKEHPKIVTYACLPFSAPFSLLLTAALALAVTTRSSSPFSVR